MHPLPILMNQGVHVALSSDDPAIFGNMGLSFDYYQVCLLFSASDLGDGDPVAQVLVASEVSGLTTMGEVARESIRVRFWAQVFAFEL